MRTGNLVLKSLVIFSLLPIGVSHANESPTSSRKTSRRKACAQILAGSLIAGSSVFYTSKEGMFFFNKSLDPTYMPVKTGNYWLYKVTVEDSVNEVKIRIGEKVTLEVEDESIEAYEIFVNETKSRQHLAIENDGFRLVKVDGVGFAGVPAIVTDEAYRWTAKQWDFTCRSGCIIDFMEGRRSRFSTTVNVPFGTFTGAMLNLTNEAGTFKIEAIFSPGIGIVKQEVTRDGKNEVWELSLFVEHN